MYQELLGRELAPGDIVAYPSGHSLDYAVITSILPEIGKPILPYDLEDGYRLTHQTGRIYGRQVYMLRRRDDNLRALVNRGFRLRRKILTNRVLLKISIDDFMNSRLSAEEKQAALNYSRSLQQ